MIRWTEPDTRRAVEMRRDGRSVEEIANMLGRTTDAVRRRFEYIDLTPARREAIRERTRTRRRKLACGENLRPCAVAKHSRPPEFVLRERDHRLAITETPNMAVLGDPLPGRSALDQKRQGASV